MSADLCPEPRDGDLYLMGGEVHAAVGQGWLLSPDGRGVRFEVVRGNLTILARREDVGAIVLAAMRWADVDTDDAVENLAAELTLTEAVRAAKENAR